MENSNIPFIFLLDILFIGDISLKIPKIAKVTGDLAIFKKNQT
jgi:hypothetical protein